MLNIFVQNELLLTLFCFAWERLTSRQKSILEYLQVHLFTHKNVSQVVKLLSQELNSSESGLRINSKQLKKISLVDFSNYNSRGIPIHLTPIGKLITRNLDRGFEK